MRKIFVLSLLLAISSAAVGAAGGAVTSFYELKTKSLDGKPADLATYRGTVSLVVNVASYCGYTPQYAGLEKLQREMKGKGFQRARVPEQRLRRTGARHRRGDRDVLQAHL
jgi:glutathione peroxidase